MDYFHFSFARYEDYLVVLLNEATISHHEAMGTLDMDVGYLYQ